MPSGFSLCDVYFLNNVQVCLMTVYWYFLKYILLLVSTSTILWTILVEQCFIVIYLGIYLDSNLSMTTHISKTVSNCFSAMRLIRSIRRSVSNAVLLSLVTALVLSRVDYGNATLAGLPARQLCRLQSVLHAAARIVFSARKFDHVTPLLQELHWLQ